MNNQSATTNQFRRNANLFVQILVSFAKCNARKHPSSSNYLKMAVATTLAVSSLEARTKTRRLQLLTQGGTTGINTGSRRFFAM